MKNLILLIPLIVLLNCCKTHTLSKTTNERIIYGYTFDKTSREGLNGTFVYNLTKGMMTVADSIGKFKLTVIDGDSIRFKFVGMKDSVIIVSHKTPSYLQIGLDTANTNLIGNKVLKRQLLDNGWYPVADYPENKIEGKAIVTAKDFASVVLDTTYRPDIPVIVGKLKVDKIPEWSSATEGRIGKRIGFVYKDSVIVAPTVNCRLESGTFTIECQDSALIRRIYNSLSDVSMVCADSIKEEAKESIKDSWEYYGTDCEFPGGSAKMMEWIEANRKLPEGFSGKECVVVGFFIQPDGKVVDGKMLRQSKDERINQEALRLVSSLPKFYVRYYTSQKEPIFRALPIVFQADDSIHNLEKNN